MFDSETLVTSSEAAAALGVSVKTITRWAASDKLVPAKRLPGLRGAMLFAATDVEALLARDADWSRDAQ